MKLMQEIVGNKVGPLIELPENFSLVEVKPFAPYKAKVLEEIKASVEEMILTCIIHKKREKSLESLR